MRNFLLTLLMIIACTLAIVSREQRPIKIPEKAWPKLEVIPRMEYVEDIPPIPIPIGPIGPDGHPLDLPE